MSLTLSIATYSVAVLVGIQIAFDGLVFDCLRFLADNKQMFLSLSGQPFFFSREVAQTVYKQIGVLL